MAQRKYMLYVFDAFTLARRLILDSESHQFQLKTAITYSSVNGMDDMIIVEVYNLTLETIPKDFINARFVLVAGTDPSSITQIQGINPNYLSMNRIIDGYVYDASLDYTEMPNVKLVFKIKPTLDVPEEYRKYNNIGSEILDLLLDENKREISTVFKEGEDIIKKIRNIFYVCTNTELYNITGEESIINNLYNITFRIDPRRNDYINKLNDLLNQISIASYRYPLAIVGTPSGYAISFDFYNFTSKNIQDFIDDKKLEINYVDTSLETATNDKTYNDLYNINKIINSYQKMFPQKFNIPNNLIIAPPIRTEANTVQICTMLMPSVKPGDVLTIGNRIGDVNYGPRITMSPNTNIVSSLSYYNNYAGTFVVQKVQHKLNYSESAPSNWCTVLEVIQRPQSKDVPYRMIYTDYK